MDLEEEPTPMGGGGGGWIVWFCQGNNEFQRGGNAQGFTHATRIIDRMKDVMREEMRGEKLNSSKASWISKKRRPKLKSKLPQPASWKQYRGQRK